MRLLLTCAFVVFAFTGLYAQSSVKGIVFEDENKNGKKERREKGIAGVAVSNGIDVTVTDGKGYYALPVGEDNIIFISKPSGYNVPLNARNQPQFYYIHKPKGHPASFKYKGTAPTGKLPKSVDFPLIAQAEPDNYTALIFGDPQPYTQEEVEHFSRGIVSEVAGIKDVAFGLSLGDLVGDDLELHSPYIHAVSEVGIPWYNVMGNHDMNYDAPADSLSDETYEANFGPANYSFNYGETHFIILDDILYPDPRDGKGYWGGFRKAQLDFVENDLKHVDKDKLIVLAFHIPLQLNDGETFRVQDRQRLFDLLKDFPNTLSLSAHTHLQRNNFYGAEDGWRQSRPHHEYNAGTTSGDWYSGELDENGVPVSTMRDGTPKGYAFIRFTGNQYVIDYKAAGKPRDHQMQIYSPKVIPNDRTSAGIYVNFFMGSKDDRVEYRIGDGEWKKMTHVEDVDPSYMSLLYRWDTTEKLMPGRRPSNGVKSTHLWRGGFPANLPLGEHTIEIRVKDMFGRQFIQTGKVEVQSPPQTE